MNTRMLPAAAVAAVLLAVSGARGVEITISHPGATITMDFANVGNAGNAADTRYDFDPGDGTLYCGSVDYNYHIGTYEVSADQWGPVSIAAGIAAGGPWTGNQPVASISWNHAAIFCNWLTSGSGTAGAYAVSDGGVTGIDRATAMSIFGTVYVIPTEDEWYKAAYYDPASATYYDYPTRDSDPDAPDGIDFSGDTAYDAVFIDGYNQNHPNDVTNAGVLGPYLTMGQGGNLFEYNETQIESGRGLRGGSFYHASSYMRADKRYYVDPGFVGIGFSGFRVAAIGPVPEPGSLGLLLLGLPGMVMRRRRST